MRSMVNKLFGSPFFFREFLFAAKYAALLQLFAALVCCGLSRFCGIFGGFESAEALREAALVTLTVAAGTEVLAWFLRRGGARF